MLVTSDIFFLSIEKIGNIPFEQTKEWYEYKQRKDVEFLFFVDNPQDPSIACWGRILIKRFIGRILDIIGDVQKLGISQKQISKFFTSLIVDAKASMITLNSVSEYSCEFEIAIRRSGFVRPLGFRTCPLTIFVNPFSYSPDRMWKRNIKKAKEEQLEFVLVEKPTLPDLRLVCSMFDELRDMKSLGYSLSAEELLNLFQSDSFKLFFVKKDDKYLCARIIYLYRNQAADVFAANSYESRKYSATNFIMEGIFSWLKEQGVDKFDFSRIPPSNNETDSVYIFKNSSGGYPVQYNGEWIWSKKRIILLFFSIYNFYVRKAHQY